MSGEQYQPPDYEAPDGSVWRRSGECNQCGECCENNPSPFRGEPQVVEGMCARFRWENGLGVCYGRDTYYHQIACSKWPSKPRHIAERPKCSYRFERIR